MYSIYKLTMPDGMSYIGMTGKEKLEQRWRYGYGYDRNKPLTEAIFYYGWHNVQKTILGTAETREEALAIEQCEIINHKTYLPEFGYNTHGRGQAPKEPTTTHIYVCKENGAEFRTLKEAGEYAGVCAECVRKGIEQHRGVGKRKLHFEKRNFTH